MSPRASRSADRGNRERAKDPMRTHSRILALLRPAAVCGLALAAAGFSRPPSRAPEIPRRFEITVRETRDESTYSATGDSILSRRFESSIAYFGRLQSGAPFEVQAPDKEHSTAAGTAYSAFNDSLFFRSEAPFRLTARLRPDTLVVASLDRGPSTSTGFLDADREMLACIFEGPALSIDLPEGDGPAEVGDLKTHCSGGLYRRLDLPVTLGAFVVSLPEDLDAPGERWSAARVCPSFSGLGFSPTVSWTYAVVENARGGEPRFVVDVSCDTTLSNVRVDTPAGAVDVVSDRIRIRGLLRAWAGVPSFYTGELDVQEDIRYVRPDLESPVLTKRCRAVISLEPR